MTEKRFIEQNLENHLNKVYDTQSGKVIFDEDIVDILNAFNDENEQLKKCNNQLARRSIALDGICNSNCQMARKETVGHGDIRWICIINRSGDSTCHFGEVCKFLEGLEPIEDITDCVW